jgi:hypothetical protein
MGRRFAFVVLAIIWSGTWAANPQTLDQQEKCAAQARKTYQEDTYKERVESQRLGVPEPMSSDYQSHYNTKLNRCLIEGGLRPTSTNTFSSSAGLSLGAISSTGRSWSSRTAAITSSLTLSAAAQRASFG